MLQHFDAQRLQRAGLLLRQQISAVSQCDAA